MIFWLLACGAGPTDPVAPAPVPVAPAPVPERAPEVATVLPTVRSPSPRPIALTGDLKRTRETLRKVVVDHARDPGNPWAVVHAMLALGADIDLADGTKAVDTLFRRYGQVDEVGGVPLITFPPDQGGALVEPHTDLILKALTEGGRAPTDPVEVDGKPFTIGDLYRHSLWRAWVTPSGTGFQTGDYNDTPWALQGLAAWAPPHLGWTARGAHPMTMDGFTDAVVAKLVAETKEMSAARAAGQSMQKDTRRGLFRYTCGGQHLLQGAAFAVGRGFGAPANQATICDQLGLLRWRIDLELTAIDPHISAAETPRALKLVLLTQRLKFLGHWLETTHKIGAIGVCPLGADDEAASQRVAGELVRTVDAIGALGVWADLNAVRTDPELDRVGRGANQVYLDLVGDSAHAVRGIDLATGSGTLLH